MNEDQNGKTDEQANLPAVPDEEVRNIYTAAHTHPPLLRFRKGKYYAGAGEGEEVPLGTEFMIYALDWRRGWRKWWDDQVVDDRVVRVADHPAPPLERDELGDMDEALWEEGLDGKPKNPWTSVNELPVENVETGERFLFSTASFGGKLAVEKICGIFAANMKNKLDKGLPIARLAVTEFKTKAYGKVARPDFIITGWENDTGGGEPVEILPPEQQKKKDFHNDEIPFAFMLAIPFIATLIGAEAFVA
jgi:hypothetical protein